MCSCRGGDGDGLFAPLSSRVTMAWKLFDPRLEVLFPMAHLAVAPARVPPQQPVPRGPAESRCHTAFPRGAHAAFTTGKQGQGSPRDTNRCLCPTPRRSAPESLPLGTVSAPRAAPLRGRGSPGARRQRVAPSALGVAAAGPGLREAAEEKGQNQKTKNHPRPWGAQLQQMRLFPGQGETRAKGQNSDVPPRRAPLRPPGGESRGRGVEPGGTGGGRGAEPGRGFASRRDFYALVRPSGASALLRRSFSRGSRMVPSPCSFLPLSPVCSPTVGGGLG